MRHKKCCNTLQNEPSSSKYDIHDSFRGGFEDCLYMEVATRTRLLLAWAKKLKILRTYFMDTLHRNFHENLFKQSSAIDAVVCYLSMLTHYVYSPGQCTHFTLW